jgi:hypothetical protein
MAKHAELRKVEVNPDEITFGVEIECMLPKDYVRARRIEVGRYHHGKQLPAPFPTGWTAQRDGSIEEVWGTVPMEIVSPVLQGVAGLQEVLNVFQYLNEAGAQVNDACGFHVHVGATSVLGDRADDAGLVVRWVRRMLHLMSRHEAALFGITGRVSRFDNLYCETIKEKWHGVLETTSDLDLIIKAVDKSRDRYYTLNIQNLFRSKRTVEFRLFGATLNGMQAVGYVITAMGIAHRAAECGTAPGFETTHEPLKPEAWRNAVKDLHHTLAAYGWPAGAKALWGKAIRRVQRRAAQRFVGVAR